MNKKCFAIMLFFLMLFFLDLRAQEKEQEQKQADEAKQALVEEWQTNPEAFAKLFFGEDLRKRTPGRRPSLEKTKKDMIEKVKGKCVEWPATFGIWQYWLNSRIGAQEQYTDNTAFYIPVGEGCIHVPLFGSWNNKKVTWGIPPLTHVQLKMILGSLKPGITEDGSPDILVLVATLLEIKTSAKKCRWPEYTRQIYWGMSGNARIQISSDNDCPIKVGLRADDGGVDFIIPPKKNISLLIQPGKYDTYFQFGDDPESLYQGDPINLERSRVQIQLKGKEGGDFKIRKIS